MEKNKVDLDYDFLITTESERANTLEDICESNDWDKQSAVVQHLEAIQNDVRDEIKQRINQRDSFAIQYLVSVGAVITAVLSTNLNVSIYFLLVAPLLAIFYSTQILYSYSMTDKISEYIRTCLDKPIEKILGTNEWESYAWRTKQKTKTKTTGIRKDFFRGSMWILTLLCLGLVIIYLSLTGMWQLWNIFLIAFACIFELYLCLKIEISLYRKKDFHLFKRRNKYEF